MKKVFLISLICSLSVTYGQENFGIFHSNYATTNAVSINPANGVMSKSFLDINLVGVKAFFNNNLVYLSKEDYQFSSIVKGNTDNLVPQYNLNGFKSKGFGKTTVNGPAVALSFGDNAFELHANAHAFSNIGNIPNDAAQYFIDQEMPAFDTYDHSKINGNALSYVEIGGSYSRNIIKKANDIISAGINFNYLIGIGGVGAKINSANYTINGSDDISLNSLNGEYMYSEAKWGAGKGFSGGLGVTYTRMNTQTQNYLHNTVSSNCNCEDYKFKLGASFIDLGYVNFKNNAFYRNFTEGSTSGNDTELQNASLDELDGIIASRTTSANQTVRKISKIYLPGAASLQADYKMRDNLYLGAAYIHGFSKGKRRFGVQRPKSLSLTPRVEFKRFEFALPISLYEWQQPQVGAMVRINNNIIIGTDKIGAFTGRTNVFGADIYVNIKLGLFKNPKCKEANQAWSNPNSNKNSVGKKNGFFNKKKSNGSKSKFNTGKKSKGKVSSYSCPAFN